MAAAAVLGLVLSGCSSSEETPEEPSAAESGAEDGTPEEPVEQDGPTESPTADVEVPGGVEVTAQGVDLEFGDTATVVFEPNQKKSTLLNLTVKKARKGRLGDFEGFILDDSYKRQASYYYVKVAVENVGEDNVGGSPVPLWGVNEKNTLLPAVNFTTEFGPCASTPLPKKFKSGDSVNTCLVYLAPDKGSLVSLSFRPDQAFDPIEWTGEVEPPKKDKKKNKKKRRGGRGNG